MPLKNATKNVIGFATQNVNMSRAQFHRLSISKVRELPDGVAITFNVPDELNSTFAFTPGQYLTIEASIQGEPTAGKPSDDKKIRRTYSICSSNQDVSLEVGIKSIENGVFSNYALSLKAGDQLDVMPPEGRFIRAIDRQNQTQTLLIAAGSGITPCLSIAKSVLASEPNSSITLINGNRTISSIMFRADIAALKDEYTDRFSVINMLSRERQDIERFNGRISAQSVTALNTDGLIRVSEFENAYLCGPMDMVHGVTTCLLELGMNKNQVHTELFTTENFAAPETDSAALADNTQSNNTRSNSVNSNNVSIKQDNADQHNVTIILDGSQTGFNVDSSTDTVLSAAQRAGIDMPFSCAGGMCCTCRCKVVEGSAKMDINFSLAEWEIKAGYMLACQARPSSEKLVLDFDSV